MGRFLFWWMMADCIFPSKINPIAVALGDFGGPLSLRGLTTAAFRTCGSRPYPHTNKKHPEMGRLFILVDDGGLEPSTSSM